MKHFLPTTLLLLTAWASQSMTASARTLEVSTAHGVEAGDGSAARPFKTISAAAQLAQPGDTVLVHAGIYRERVDPPRGGTSDARRITYKAAPGGKVVITGSDPVKGWEKVAGDTWKLTIRNQSFGNFNPYVDTIRGDWFLPQGRVHHTGCVYLNGDWLIEAPDLESVMKPVGKTGLWFAQVDGNDGALLMNVAKIKPSAGAVVSGGEPSFRYGGSSAACNEGGTCSGFIQNGHWLRFDDLDFGTGSDSVDLRVAAPAGAGCRVELRLNNPEGPYLGVCEGPATGAWTTWTNVAAKIRQVSGKQTLCLVFKTAKLDAGNTVIHAQFPGGVNPNEAKVEINRRQTVFYPSKNFVNYITVSGFTLQNAATNWAAPSSEQTAIVGTNWSKGWVIENNEIAYSKCCGISLGKYGDGTDNTNGAGAADPYTECVRRALKHGWNKDTIGSHTVRNNHVHHCEQAGIVGSMGCAFSTIVGNDIHDIHTRALFAGWEQAGIKFHGAVDTVIANNHIHAVNSFGIWLDWMAQGSQVTGNLLDGNNPDILCEMLHGPMIIANNLLLSKQSMLINAKGLALAHNLMVGHLNSMGFDARNTPFQVEHSTEIVGLSNAQPGDHRLYNNLCAGAFNAHALNTVQLPCFAAGNVFTKGAKPSKFDADAVVKPDFDAKVSLTQKADGWYLTLAEDKTWKDGPKRKLVTTELLGNAKIPNLPYKNTTGSPLAIDTDYFGKKRDAANPFPGPFEVPINGEIKVWPK